MRLWRACPIVSHDNRSPASQFTGLPMTLSPVDLALEFPQAPNLLYFNHAAVAPWPRRAAEAVTRFAVENVRNGAIDYRRWLEVERSLRERLARLINAASADQIALLKNTSEGLSAVAFGLAWRPGDNIVGIARDFPSNRVVWEALDRIGVELRPVDVNSAPDPEAALIAACDGRTRLLAVSWVHYVTGLRLDLERLGSHCRSRDILFCVDAIQGLGALRLDVQACGADFVAGDGHKWLLGPEGVALFYVSTIGMDRLTPCQLGWHSLARSGDYDRTDRELAPSARRFEPGSPNLLGIHALEASVALLETVGPDVVETRVLEHTARLRSLLPRARPEITLQGPDSPNRWSGIVSFRPAGRSADDWVAYLGGQGVFCAARSGCVRVSPHFYNTENEIARFLRLLS
jgi:selenocysteine lyase/cysteine desulfurase